MIIQVAGKGGAGKTTVAGTLARSFAAAGHEVLAIDDDHDPNLGISVGVDADTSLPPVPDDVVERVTCPDGEPTWELTTSPREIIDEYGIKTHDGLTLLRGGKITAGDGTLRYTHAAVARLMVGEGREQRDVTILDMPAGLAVYGMPKYVDVVLGVVEPTYKSLETIRKLDAFAREYSVPAVKVVANDVRSTDDVEFIEDYCTDQDLPLSTIVPSDDAVRRAEQRGGAPVDSDGYSPAVCAIRDLAEELAAGIATGEYRRPRPTEYY